MASWPLPSRATFCVPGVRYSTRPLLVGAPVSWYQVDGFTPEPDGPLKSSDHVSVAPDPVEAGTVVEVVGGTVVVDDDVTVGPGVPVVVPFSSIRYSPGMDPVLACRATTSLA